MKERYIYDGTKIVNQEISGVIEKKKALKRDYVAWRGSSASGIFQIESFR